MGKHLPSVHLGLALCVIEGWDGRICLGTSSYQYRFKVKVQYYFSVKCVSITYCFNSNKYHK